MLFTYKNFKKIIAVEPSPDNLQILEKNIHLNNINNVEIVNKAVSLKRGRVKLYLADNPYNSSIVFESNRYVEVDAITLNELLLPYNTIDLIKIDVEGAELDVIKSGISQLHKVKKIVIEVRNQYESEIDNILIKEGFKKCVLEDRGHEKNILYYVGEQ
ncbi:FkbM family methyltransferase [Saccharolobus caldissimus]|uniref:FkbM family methyltransferase n=1 Tax=Saccharolobus caldissimus TaxID=1702097 RepID=UPI001E5475F1|nr:FkbM family methyltransferase [Saccharolobus caldissimus]